MEARVYCRHEGEHSQWQGHLEETQEQDPEPGQEGEGEESKGKGAGPGKQNV